MEDQNELPFSDSHAAVRIRIDQFRSVGSFSLWEKVWGNAHFFAQVCCDEAEGPDEFYTKSFPRRKTVTINECFTFVLSEYFAPVNEETFESLPISIALYKNGTFFGRENIDATFFKLNKNYLLTLRYSQDQDIMKLDIEIEKYFVSRPQFRYSVDISRCELEAREQRRKFVFENMKKFIPQETPLIEEEVPTIAVACSGGGYRSTIQFCGAMEAMAESGLLDCVTYLSGLSGGSWYILPAYAKEALGNKEDLMDFHSEIKAAAKSSLVVSAIADFSHYLKYRKHASAKEAEGQPVTFVDFYGYTLGKTFLGNEKLDVKLSGLRRYASSGEAPIPIITALHTRSKVSSATFHADLEITPWEVSMPNYGINLRTDMFGSEWYSGTMVRCCPELPLHFYIGASSSAFGILLKYFLGGETTETDSKFIEDIRRHEFGKYNTKRRRSMKERYESRKFRKQLSSFSTSSEGEEEIQWRQRSRSSTKRSRKKHAAAAAQANTEEIPTIQISEPLPVPRSPMRKRFSSAGSDYFTADEGEQPDPLPDIQEDAVFQQTKPDTLLQVPDLIKKRRRTLHEIHLLPSVETNQTQTNVQESYWRKILKKVSHHPLFTDREAVIDRTAKVLNCARGLSDIQYFSMNPDHAPPNASSSDRLISTEANNISYVDAAVINNVPTNVLLRPQRKTDILIVCDATEYKSDTDIDYLELFIAERIAREQGLKYPPINPQKLKDDPRGAVHVFEDKKDPECPIVIWFTLSNSAYRKLENVEPPPKRRHDENYKLPQNEKFNDFPVYGPQSCYTTLNTRYTPLQFDRLKELMKHSFTSKMDTIRRQIRKKIIQKRRQSERNYVP